MEQVQGEVSVKELCIVIQDLRKEERRLRDEILFRDNLCENMRMDISKLTNDKLLLEREIQRLRSTKD
jgi:hypothetical protein